MDNLFGKILRDEMQNAGIKEGSLADILCYDATYISKWINGNKLPSSRNSERILRQIADFFADETGVPAENFYGKLREAYESDSNYMKFQSYSNNKLSFTDNWKILFGLIQEAILLSVSRNDGVVEITSTFDLFNLYGQEFREILQSLKNTDVNKVELKLSVNPENLEQKGLSYVEDILRTIGSFDYIEISIVALKKDSPSILIINDILYVQMLWCRGNDMAAAFSVDRETIEKFLQIGKLVISGAESLLDPAEPRSLKETNVQIGSYSDKRQWLFFNEPPAMLFPDEIMDMFIKESDDEEYSSYLMKLKNTFVKWTCRSEIDLVLYASMFNKYLSDGCVSVGNVSHKLTEEQVHSHLKYITKVMEENMNFRVWMIRNTVQLDESIRNCPSLFIDTQAMYIENSRKGSNDNFHISMNPEVRTAFQNFFEHMIEQSYCSRLSPEDILRYI